jgi:GNAT superfamily N-acetyltransferase
VQLLSSNLNRVFNKEQHALVACFFNAFLQDGGTYLNSVDVPFANPQVVVICGFFVCFFRLPNNTNKIKNKRKEGIHMVKYIESSLNENTEYFEKYKNSLSSRYDDFLEDHILDSKIYSIHINDVHLGYFGVHKNNMLTQFVMPISEVRNAQSIFKDILKVFEIKNAFVPTCDELFLSLCLDNYKKINLQAYLFEDSGKVVRPAEYDRELLYPATQKDLPEILSITGDFIDLHEERIKKGQLYVLREKGEFLGMGIIVDNKIMKNCKGTGMFTNEKHRQKGVGRSIILHLKDICHTVGVTPIPGCWYYNHNSKRTLESAGYITKTRLLNIEF